MDLHQDNAATLATLVAAVSGPEAAALAALLDHIERGECPVQATPAEACLAALEQSREPRLATLGLALSHESVRRSGARHYIRRSAAEIAAVVRARAEVAYARAASQTSLTEFAEREIEQAAAAGADVAAARADWAQEIAANAALRARQKQEMDDWRAKRARTRDRIMGLWPDGCAAFLALPERPATKLEWEGLTRPRPDSTLVESALWGLPPDPNDRALVAGIIRALTRAVADERHDDYLATIPDEGAGCARNIGTD